MKKSELAECLAIALNILNDVQSQDETDQNVKNQIHDLLMRIPRKILVETDYRNNGEVAGEDLL